MTANDTSQATTVERSTDSSAAETAPARPTRDPATAAETAPARPTRDPATTWAKPVDRLSMGAVPAEAVNLNVAGKRLAGPVQGFGQLWQKTYRITFEGASPTPQEVVAVWKREFPSFWPANAHFYAPFTEIAPGEVGLINNDVPGRQVLSTGVMVIYADDESFSFMTPEGHVFAAWITFSAARDEAGATVAQVQTILRASDPFFEVMMMAGGQGQENRHWQATLTNLAARFGATGTPTVEQVCVDRRRQWRHIGNIRHNSAIRSGLWTMAHPGRMLRRRKA
jgi:hypothetical protein